MELNPSHRKAKFGLVLAAAGFAGAVAGGTVPRYPAEANGYACWDLGELSQLHSAKNRSELLADNPLACELKAPGSSQDWAWAGPCTGCKKLDGKVDLIPDSSFEAATDTWYAKLPDGTRAYTVGLPVKFQLGTRMVRLWIEASAVHRSDGNPMPENPKGD
jgi:hypothetical protein